MNDPFPPINSEEAIANQAYVREVVEKLKKLDVLPLAESVAARHGMELAEVLCGRCSPRPRIRRELWSALYDVVPCYSWVGRLFRRDHTTISTAIRKHKTERAIPPRCVLRRPEPILSEGSVSCVGADDSAVRERSEAEAETSGEAPIGTERESAGSCAL